MNASPHLQTAIRRLFSSWLLDCQFQVGAHISLDGRDPAAVAQACPLTFGDPAVASWAMEQNGHNRRDPPCS